MRGREGFKDGGMVVEAMSSRNWWDKQLLGLIRSELERQTVVVREWFLTLGLQRGCS